MEQNSRHEQQREMPGLAANTAAGNATGQPTLRRGNRYKIEITQLDAGFVVKVGCKEFAINSKSHLLHLLERYITDPEGTERRYNMGQLFED